METVFLAVLHMSLKGSCVIAAVLLVRWLLRKAPKKYSFLLWTAAAFRLICPVSFESAFSLFGLRPAAVEQSAAALPEVTVSPAIPQTVTAPVMDVTVETPAAQLQAAVDPMQLLLSAAIVIWVLGVAVMLLCGVVSYLRLKRKLRTAVSVGERVWCSDQVRSPFLLGIFCPRIYLPYGLDAAAMEHVLTHERCHVRGFDHVIRPAAYLILALHWFNPLVWLAFVLMSRDMELRCDEAVLSGMTDPVAYSETLLAFASNRRMAVLTPLAFGESAVKTRIKNALKWKKPRLWLTVLTVCVCAAVIAACAADPREPVQTPQEEEQEENQEQHQPQSQPETELPQEKPEESETTPPEDSSETAPETQDVTADFSDQTVWVARECLVQLTFSSHFPLQGNSGKTYHLGGGIFLVKDQNTGETLVTQACNDWSWTELTSDHWLCSYLYKAGLAEENDPELPQLLELEEGWFLLKLRGRLCVGQMNRNKTVTELYGLQPYGEPARCELYASADAARQWLLDLIWYEGGYTNDHSSAGTIRVSGDMTLQLVPTWSCSHLAVELEYYEAKNGRLVPELETVQLQPEADGSFLLNIVHRNPSEHEQVILMVPTQNGDYAVRIQFEAKTRDPQKAAAAYMASLDGYAGHEILTCQTLVACGANAKSSYEETTVYAMMACYLEQTELVYWLPTVLVYRVEETGCENIGFWQPEEYGDYMTQIRRNFPETSLDAETTALMQEKARTARIDYLLTLVHAYGPMHPDMKTVLKDFEDEYQELLSYGEYTLLRIYDHFLDGNETGVKGDFMRLLMDELTGVELAMDAANGQEYFNAWMAHMQKLADENGETWLKNNYYEAWLLLQMIGG